MSDVELPEITRLDVIKIESGDVVVLSLADQHLSVAALHALLDRLKEQFPDNEVLVLDGGTHLSVVRPEFARPGDG